MADLCLYLTFYAGIWDHHRTAPLSAERASTRRRQTADSARVALDRIAKLTGAAAVLLAVMIFGGCEELTNRGASIKPAPKPESSSRRPLPVGTILAITLTVGAEPATIDVAGSFHDPDGQTLTFSARSSARTVATISVSGSTVTVTAVARGTATITVIATDEDNLTASQAFGVTVTAPEQPEPPCTDKPIKPIAGPGGQRGDEIPPVPQNPNDFIGRVLFFKDPKHGWPRSNTQPLPDAIVTITAGPKIGESVITDQNGYYFFSHVEGDTLRLRVEKDHYEPKEVFVHRSRPTKMANGDEMNYTGDTQKHPGNILVGMAWPDDVRFILRDILVVYDPLYVDAGTPDHEDAGGFYDQGLVAVYCDHVARWYGRDGVLGIVAHEIAHMHQHALVSVDGSRGSPHDWVTTPEAKAFAEAREKDWATVGKTKYDIIPHFSSLVENAAETSAYYWADRAGFREGFTKRWGKGEYRGLNVEAPNRFKWAEEWLK